MKTQLPYKELSASEITDKALEELIANGARVRRVHNVSAYRQRKNHVKSGWPDIQGFSRTGVAILCETKKIGDTMKKAQIDLFNDAKQCGCICLIASQDKITGRFIMIPYEIILL